MTTQKFWKIGELAKLTGLTIRTLRYYDQIGLFTPSEYSQSGYRLYSEPDITRLQQILVLKELGLSLEKIKSMLDNENFNLNEVVSLQMSRLKENIRNQQKLLKELQHVSNLMQVGEALTVENFTQLLHMMKKSHERYFTSKKFTMESHLDQLGHLLTDNQGINKKERNN